MRRTPRNYNGTLSPVREIRNLLPEVLQDIESIHLSEGHLLFQAWPSIVGEKLAHLTKPCSFVNGILTIQVISSTLYSLLAQHEKHRLLKQMKNKFPKASIRDILFRMG